MKFAGFSNDELYRIVFARNERTDSIAKHPRTSTIVAPDLIQIARQRAGGNEAVNNYNDSAREGREEGEGVEGVEGRKEDIVEAADIVAGAAVNVIDTADFTSNVMNTTLTSPIPASMHPNIVSATSNSGINVSDNDNNVTCGEHPEEHSKIGSKQSKQRRTS